jgi:hypothetical protein
VDRFGPDARAITALIGVSLARHMNSSDCEKSAWTIVPCR